MRRIKTKLLVSIFGCLFLIAFGYSLEAVDKLELKIKTDKTEFLLGEPVIVLVSLKNSGTSPIKVMKFLEPDYGFVDYIIIGTNENQTKFIPWALKEHPAPQVELAVGETISAEAKIFFGGNGWTFSNPGKYEIQALYLKDISSNILTISVVTPTNESSKKAAELFLNSDEVGYFLIFNGGDHLKKGMQVLEEVASKFPDTPYASYSNFALGANLMKDFADFQNNKLRKANPEMAVKYLEKAKDKSLNFYQALHTHFYLSEAYNKMGDAQKARDIQMDLEKTVKEKFPGYQSFLDYIQKKKIK